MPRFDPPTIFDGPSNLEQALWLGSVLGYTTATRESVKEVWQTFRSLLEDATSHGDFHVECTFKDLAGDSYRYREVYDSVYVVIAVLKKFPDTFGNLLISVYGPDMERVAFIPNEHGQLLKLGKFRLQVKWGLESCPFRSI